MVQQRQSHRFEHVDFSLSRPGCVFASGLAVPAVLLRLYEKSRDNRKREPPSWAGWFSIVKVVRVMHKQRARIAMMHLIECPAAGAHQRHFFLLPRRSILWWRFWPIERSGRTSRQATQTMECGSKFAVKERREVRLNSSSITSRRRAVGERQESTTRVALPTDETQKSPSMPRVGIP